jgi:hypothetical protein
MDEAVATACEEEGSRAVAAPWRRSRGRRLEEGVGEGSAWLGLFIALALGFARGFGALFGRRRSSWAVPRRHAACIHVAGR